MNLFKAAIPPQLITFPEDVLVLAFCGRNLLLHEQNGTYFLPEENIVEHIQDSPCLLVGTYDNKNCVAIELKSMAAELFPSIKAVDFREAIKLLTAEESRAASYARQMLHWEQEHRFCGNCSAATSISDREMARVCPDCGALFFPRISPAVIVAVTHGDKILLAHNHNFRTGLYSTVAGFAEPAETLEETVAREVLEETGIKIKNIRYFGSQSWPFPHSLMIGFMAEYDSGEITPDGVEIETAGWFSIDQLPEIPSHGSISRQLIDNFINSQH
ncbi:MAG: NAD(+) diphosphatase [Victivallaceae bacterium]